MPSDYQGPFLGQQESATSALTSQQRKIDPMSMMGRIFASLGAILVVIGVLIASLLGLFAPGGFGFFFAILAGVWGTGLLFLLLGLALLRFFRNVRSAVVVDHFLMALLNQDYPAAFQFLDPDIMTGQNELDAHTWFTRLAQAYDEQGRMSDYALRGFSLNPRRASYTIKMRRSAGPYLVQLFLLKRDDTWNIIGFDRF